MYFIICWTISVWKQFLSCFNISSLNPSNKYIWYTKKWIDIILFRLSFQYHDQNNFSEFDTKSEANLSSCFVTLLNILFKIPYWFLLPSSQLIWMEYINTPFEFNKPDVVQLYQKQDCTKIPKIKFVDEICSDYVIGLNGKIFYFIFLLSYFLVQIFIFIAYFTYLINTIISLMLSIHDSFAYISHLTSLSTLDVLIIFMYCWEREIIDRHRFLIASLLTKL